MIISQEQIARAVEYLRTPSGNVAAVCAGTEPGSVSPELLDRVRAALDECPDVREDRIAQARAFMAAESPSSDEVAEKLIGRIVSDSLR